MTQTSESLLPPDPSEDSPGFANRLHYLESLPTDGWELPQMLDDARHLIAAVGLPVSGLTQLSHASNSWRTYDHRAMVSHEGRLTFLDNYDFESPAKRLATVVHELGHLVDPEQPGGTGWYRDEMQRRAAAHLRQAAAVQALYTGVYLNRYHQQVVSEYLSGRVNSSTLMEETWAILCQMALTEREKLAEVSAAQHAALLLDTPPRLFNTRQVLARQAVYNKKPTPLPLITQKGGAKPVGVDAFLIDGLVEGTHSISELDAHISYLQASAYRYANTSRQYIGIHALLGMLSLRPGGKTNKL